MIEDLHWMDEGSEALAGRDGLGAVEGTADAGGRQLPARVRRPSGPTRRSTGRSRWSRSGPSRPSELLRDLAGEDPSLDGLAELIHERTGGNPFFIEEIVRELVEAGYLEGERGAYRLARPVEDTGVPATVQAILAARIDRLEPGARRCCRSPRWSARRSASAALRMVAGVDDEELAEGLRS